MAKKLIKHKLLQVSAELAKPQKLRAVHRNTTSMSGAELQARIDRVSAFAMANAGVITSQIEALKRCLPSDLPTVLAGPIKRRR